MNELQRKALLLMKQGNLKKSLKTVDLAIKINKKIAINFYIQGRIFQELMDFNEKHPFAAITADSVYRSMQSHKETSKNIMVNNGINISKQNRAYIMLLEDEWDPDYNFDRLFGFG